VPVARHPGVAYEHRNRSRPHRRGGCGAQGSVHARLPTACPLVPLLWVFVCIGFRYLPFISRPIPKAVWPVRPVVSTLPAYPPLRAISHPLRAPTRVRPWWQPYAGLLLHRLAVPTSHYRAESAAGKCENEIFFAVTG